MDADTYDDLPDWIRPGAKLAVLDGGHTLVTVKKITRTQIVTYADSSPAAEYRFDRKPVPPNQHTGRGEEWRLRGSYFTSLQRRDHPQVVAMRIDAIARNAAAKVAELRRAYGNPDRADERNHEERALDLLDGIENAARTARRKVDNLLNPSTLASAQYAQDLEA